MSRPVGLARFALAAGALGFGGFGLVLLAFPGLLGGVGVEAVSPSGTVELRAFYGGLELGLAAFLLLALFRPAWHRSALTLELCALGGIVVARGAALMLTGGEANAIVYGAWAGEGAMALLAAVALWRHPGPGAGEDS